MIQQKLSLFQCLTSVPSKAVGLEEMVRLIRYDSGVTGRTESYRQMARVLGKEKADEKITLMNVASIAQYINGGVVGRGLSSRKVGIVMGKMGFKKIHTMRGWFYEVFLIPPDQIQATLAMTENRSDDINSPITFAEGELTF